MSRRRKKGAPDTSFGQKVEGNGHLSSFSVEEKMRRRRHLRGSKKKERRTLFRSGEEGRRIFPSKPAKPGEKTHLSPRKKKRQDDRNYPSYGEKKKDLSYLYGRGKKSRGGDFIDSQEEGKRNQEAKKSFALLEERKEKKPSGTQEE